MTVWTENRIDRLKVMLAAGLSASQCAEQLGGTTRNAVIGVKNRRGMEGGKPKSVKLAQIGERRPTRIAPLKAAKPKPTAEEIHATSLPPDQSPCAVNMMAVTDHTCRWPIDGKDGPMMYCGAKPSEESPYCSRHSRLAYRAPVRIDADEQARRSAEATKMFNPARSRVA